MENFNELAQTWDNEPRRVERAKIVADEIRKAIPNLHQLDGFEYGCGTGLLSLNLQPYLHHITLGDNSDGMLSMLAEKIEKANIRNMTPMKVDFTTDPIIELKSDIIYTLMTMHHIVNIDTVLHAFIEILNPGGYLCIADLDREDGSFHGQGFTGHNGFDRMELAERLTKHGFSDIRCETCYLNRKADENGTERIYSMFLMIGRKAC